MQEEKVKHLQSLDEENNVVSATEMTGAIPAIRLEQAHSPRDCERGKPTSQQTQ